MMVTANGLQGSIGGGNLEYEATRTARTMLEGATKPLQQALLYGLGPALNQCCGGAVTLLFETLLSETNPAKEYAWLSDLLACRDSQASPLLITAIDHELVSKWTITPGKSPPEDLPKDVAASISAYRDDEENPQLLGDSETDRFLIERVESRRLSLLLFGAGHVAKAVVDELARQPFNIRWIDSRAAQFPEQKPDGVAVIVNPDPVSEVDKAARDSIYLVMTHSHELDENICFEVLGRQDAAWLGLIGSISKRRRFVHRLSKRGVSEERLEKLVCPVGLAGILGKRPATIAVSIAAQLLRDVVPENWR